jgi:DNA-binding response OmpR family regulator
MNDRNEAMTILIVDDKPDAVTYLRTFLEHNTFAVITAGDGKEGFEKAKFWHPDLITLDITMPEESGVRLLRNLQQDTDTAGIPIVIVTGASHEFKRFIETRKRLRPLADYFEKPIDREQFLARINEILSARAV